MVSWDLSREWVSHATRPTVAQESALGDAEAALAKALGALNQLTAEDVATFREKVAAAGFTLLPGHEPLAVPPRD